MDSVLLESPTEARSLGFGLLAGPSYETMLKESIDRFLSEIQKETLDFSAFRSIFFRLLQSSADPPLEIIWFYSAVSYHENVSSKNSALDRLAVKDLLQLLEACSASCSGSKSIALLAPALSYLHRWVMEEEKVSGMAGKKVRKEIECLAEGILSYISICSSKSCNGEDLSTGLLPCFLDLVRVWTVGRTGSGSGLEVLFPLVSDEIRKGFGKEGCGIGHLAGVVIAEAFLLRLCLKVREGGDLRPELQKEMRIWAISSVTVFQNHVFFEILLKLLLDPTLPVLSLLNSKDENLVRDILYDVVILVEYSFLNRGMEVDQSYDCMMSLAISKLIVTNDAIRIARAKGDHVKAITYMNAFSTSCLPNQLIKWVANQIGTERLNWPNATTPQVLLKWLVGLEEQGLRLFEDSGSNLRTKLIVDESNTASEVSVFNSESKKTNGELFVIDNRGEVGEEGVGDEEMESMDTVFLAAARSMKSPASNGRRKRKESGGDEGETPVKFVKYKIHDSSLKEYFSPSVATGISSGSEVDNPPSDDEIEEIDQ